MSTWEPGDEEISFVVDNSEGRYTRPATGGFIQFGDGPRIPVENIRWTDRPKFASPPEGAIVNLRDFSVEIPIPPENAAPLARALGAPEVADRIEIATHPDLAELDAQMDGYYDGPGR